MLKLSSLESITERDQIRHIFYFEGQPVVSIGSIHKGSVGCICVFAYVIVTLLDYKGALAPMDRHTHHEQVLKGQRPRGYYGQIVSYRNSKYVITDKHYKFVPSDEGFQTQLF